MSNKRTVPGNRGLVALGLVMTLILAPTLALGAVNQGFGQIGTDAAALTDSNTITLTATAAGLSLVKRAFQADGTPIADLSVLPKNSTVRFMIYVDNTSSITINDVRITDPLTGFTYKPGTLHVDNTVATGATDAAIYASVSASATCPLTALACTDASDADVVNFVGSTVAAGDTGAGNAQLNIGGSLVWAMLFDVTID